MTRKGWTQDSVRHGLASRGIPSFGYKGPDFVEFKDRYDEPEKDYITLLNLMENPKPIEDSNYKLQLSQHLAWTDAARDNQERIKDMDVQPDFLLDMTQAMYLNPNLTANLLYALMNGKMGNLANNDSLREAVIISIMNNDKNSVKQNYFGVLNRLTPDERWLLRDIYARKLRDVDHLDMDDTFAKEVLCLFQGLSDDQIKRLWGAMKPKILVGNPSFTAKEMVSKLERALRVMPLVDVYIGSSKLIGDPHGYFYPKNVVIPAEDTNLLVDLFRWAKIEDFKGTSLPEETAKEHRRNVHDNFRKALYALNIDWNKLLTNDIRYHTITKSPGKWGVRNIDSKERKINADNKELLQTIKLLFSTDVDRLENEWGPPAHYLPPELNMHISLLQDTRKSYTNRNQSKSIFNSISSDFANVKRLSTWLYDMGISFADLTKGQQKQYAKLYSKTVTRLLKPYVKRYGPYDDNDKIYFNGVDDKDIAAYLKDPIKNEPYHFFTVNERRREGK